LFGGSESGGMLFVNSKKECIVYIMIESINPEIKQFTKEQSREERDVLAIEIREKRKKYFEKKKNTSERIFELERDAENTEIRAETKRKEIELIYKEISDKQSSKITELFNFLRLRSLRKKLETKKDMIENIEDDYLKIKQLLESLDESYNNRSELKEAKDILTKFYENKNEEWNKYTEYLKNTDITNVAEKYNVNFIHAIHPNFIPGRNSPLQENVDWKTKLKIVIALEPSISVSTIEEGDDWHKMWARMGFILNGGHINSARSGDQATIPTGLKSRHGQQPFGYKTIVEDIEHSITEKNRGYNEFAVDNPKIAGFYICTDDTGNVIRNDLVPTEEITGILSGYKIPIYIVFQGVVFETEYNNQTKTLKRGNKILPTELLKKQFKLDDSEKMKIKEDLFEDSPFKINPAEMSKIDARAQGRQTYIEINFWHGTNKDLSDNSSLTEFPKVGARVKYSVESGKLTKRELNTRTGEENWEGGGLRERDSFNGGWIHIGYSTANLGHPIDDNDSYLTGVKKELEKWQEKIEEYQLQNNDQGIKLSENFLNCLIFHLYGFTEQAGEMNDTETQNKATKLVEQYLSREKYENVIRNRIDSDGRLKITEEDLESFR
jgi:hypothetical protein